MLIHNNHADYVISMLLGYSIFSLVSLVLNLIESYMYKKTENLGMSTIDIIANEIEKELNKNEQV